MNNIIIYSLSVLFCVLWGAHAWFTWNLDSGMPQIVTYVVIIVIMLRYAMSNGIPIKPRDSKNLCGFGFLLISSFFYIKSAGFQFLIPMLLSFVPLFVIANDKNNAEIVMYKVCKWTSILLVPGLILHLYMIFLGLFPGIPIGRGNGLYMLFNYGILLESTSAETLRFQSLFLEPGFLGTFLSFMLYADGFNTKKTYTWIFLISIALSLSLAGIITTVIGYIFLLFSRGFNVKKSIFIFICFFIFYEVGINYNDGNNLINKKVISRLEITEEGDIVGNNRFSNATNIYFDELISDGKLLTGLGMREIYSINGGANDGEWDNSQIRGAGYKIFILYYGLLAAYCFLLTYWFLGPYHHINRKYMIGFVILIVLTFIQSAYPMSYSWLIPFLLGRNKNVIKANSSKN